MMRLTQISYTVKAEIAYRLEERITVTAELEDGDDLKESCDKLRKQAMKISSPHINDLHDEITAKEGQLRKLDRAIEESFQKWEQLRHFYAAQGIKELAAIPQFNNLLPPTIQGEIVDTKQTSTTSRSDTSKAKHP